MDRYKEIDRIMSTFIVDEPKSHRQVLEKHLAAICQRHGMTVAEFRQRLGRRLTMVETDSSVLKCFQEVRFAFVNLLNENEMSALLGISVSKYYRIS